MNSMSDDAEPVHSLDLQGTGFFSRGSCTGCGWAKKGHADDIRSSWAEYHRDGKLIESLPTRVVIPPPLDYPVTDRIEQRIIVLLTHHVDFQNPYALHVASGLAEARSLYLVYGFAQPPAEDITVFLDSTDYISTLMARIANISARQREKLRLPTRTRQEQQAILEQ